MVAQWGKKLLDALLHGLAHIGVFSGRATRLQFWTWLIFVGVLLFLLQWPIMALLVEFSGVKRGVPPVKFFYMVMTFSMLSNFALFGLTVSMQVRRLHDLNRRGWWILLLLVPMLMTMLSTLWGVSTGTTPLYAPAIGGAKLMHDLETILTMAGSLLFLVWNCLRGTRGENRFGPDPLA